MVKQGNTKDAVMSIPEMWEIKKLKDVAPLQRGFDLPYSQMKTGIYPVVFSNGIGAYHSEYMIPGPGVVTGRSGTIGKVHFVQKNYWPHNTSLWVTDFHGNHEKYIYYLFKRINWNAFNSGSGVPTLNRNDVHETEIMLPPLVEQISIAAALSDIDDLITNLEKLISKKKAIKQGAMQELLTGKRRLPGFGGDWAECVLTDVADLMTDTIPVSDIDSRYYIGTDNMVSNCGGIKQNRIELQYAAVRRYVVNDILLSNIRPYLKKIWFADTNGGCSSDVLVIRAKSDGKVLARFLYQLLSQDAFFDEVTANAVGTKMPRGDKNVIKAYPLCMPVDLQEQREILKILSEMQVEIENLEKNLNKYKQIKQGMMSELLTGRIRLIDKEDA